MPFFLQRALRSVLSRQSWLLPLLVIVFVFLSSWGLLALAEPDNAVVAADKYWWYFLITASTVGYGDFYPQSLAGRLVGGYVVIGGIVTLTIIFTRVSAILENVKGRRMHGRATHDVEDHVVILGYSPGRTEWLVEALVAEGTTVVLAAWPEDLIEHPLPEQPDVHFVRGDLIEIGVLERAGCGRARAVLVDARDDNEATSLAVAVEEAATDTHTVVTLRDLERSRTVRRVNDTVQCVQWHNLNLIIEELADPGIAEVYRELMTSDGMAGTFSTELPAGAETTYGELKAHLGDAHGATPLALRLAEGIRVNPPGDTPVPTGAVLYYIGDRRLSGADLARP